MKRITFVFIGIVAIATIIVLSQKQIEDKSVKIVKVENSKYYKKGIYN